MGQAKQRGTFEERAAKAKGRRAVIAAEESLFAARVNTLAKKLGIQLVALRPASGGLVWASVAELENLAGVIRREKDEAAPVDVSEIEAKVFGEADAPVSEAAGVCPCGDEPPCGICAWAAAVCGTKKDTFVFARKVRLG